MRNYGTRHRRPGGTDFDNGQPPISIHRFLGGGAIARAQFKMRRVVTMCLAAAAASIVVAISPAATSGPPDIAHSYLFTAGWQADAAEGTHHLRGQAVPDCTPDNAAHRRLVGSTVEVRNGLFPRRRAAQLRLGPPRPRHNRSTAGLDHGHDRVRAHSVGCRNSKRSPHQRAEERPTIQRSRSIWPASPASSSMGRSPAQRTSTTSGTTSSHSAQSRARRSITQTSTAFTVTSSASSSSTSVARR